jgi:two-component system, LuxR family, sensor kinase FixL
MENKLATQMLDLRKGDHLCLFYEKDPIEQMPALIPFIQDGLLKGEQCIYIAADQTIDALTRHLEDGGVNVGKESAQGRLNLWTRKEWRQPGNLDSRRKSLQVRQFIADASRAGFQGIRFAVEMTWTLGPDIEASQLEHWEASINTLFEPDFPGRIICQYNRSRLSPDALLAAMYTHPQLVLGNDVYSNIFYQAPLILNGNGDDRNGNGERHSVVAQVEWMISQLKRARAAELAHHQLLEARIALAEAEQRCERTRAEETLGRLGAIVESSNDAIVGKDLNGIIKSWNQGAQRLFGYAADEVIGKSVTVLMPPDRQNEEPMILARIRRGERIDHYETVRQRKDGRLVDISLTVSPIRNTEGRIIGVSKIARDITDRKKAEAELAKWQGELEFRVKERTAELSRAYELVCEEFDERKRLESEIARAVEHEQLRLGQALHDGLGQELVGITYQMSALHDRLSRLSPPSAREVGRLESMLRNSADRARNLARDFYPVELETGGLAVALRRLAHNTKASFGVACKVQSDKACKSMPAASVAIQLFRIAQEAVHNAVKHANAKQIVIRLAKKQGHFVLSIKDDGAGFPSANGDKAKGMGLRIMHHRAGLIDGELRFGNDSTGGALVVCSVPDLEHLVTPSRKRQHATNHSRETMSLAV